MGTRLSKDWQLSKSESYAWLWVNGAKRFAFGMCQERSESASRYQSCGRRCHEKAIDRPKECNSLEGLHVKLQSAYEKVLICSAVSGFLTDSIN